MRLESEFWKKRKAFWKIARNPEAVRVFFKKNRKKISLFHHLFVTISPLFNKLCRAHWFVEKRQHLQKEAVKVQINLDTDVLNKIESLRNSHRRAAMQDLEEWRSYAEMPILRDISGKTQENRKAYR